MSVVHCSDSSGHKLLRHRPELAMCPHCNIPFQLPQRPSHEAQTYLFMYFGPILYFGYYHSHDGTSVGCSKREELLVGCDITIP